MDLIKALRRLRRQKVITLTDLAPRPLKFKIASHVEEYRTARYGGERDILSRFLHELEPDDVVYDIGASVGLYTVAAATLVPRGKVVAFEPDPETRRRLKVNLRINRLSNVQLVSWAVSDRSGTTDLYTNGVEGHAPSLGPTGFNGGPRRRVSVRRFPLDTAIGHSMVPLPDVIKIDIEGAEALLLQGAKHLLQGKWNKRPRLILLELHLLFLSQFNSSPAMVKQFLQSLGYRLEYSQPRNEQEHLFYVDDPSESVSRIEDR